jgi:ribonuclease BN (tRNA processing enzyme)
VAIFLVIIKDMENRNDTITFLGTAGARIMVTKQFLASGGAWLELGGTRIILDPGPGSLVQATKRKLDPSKLDAILLSHKHIDHSVDINIMVEAMTEGGFKHRGALYAPSDCFGEEGVILPYLRGYPEKVEYLEEGKKYSVGDTVIETPVKHQHPVETYGFIFQTPRATFSWIIDTRYFEKLASYYRGDLIIVNMVLMKQKDFVDHLSPDEVRLIIKQLKPKVAIITHFGMGVWKARPWEIAKTLSDETGVRVLSARDGMKVDLANLETL